MTIEPGLFRPPPLRNRSPSGNGVTGGAFCRALALEYPKFATLTKIGEKICVACVLRVYRLVSWATRKVGTCGLARLPLSVVAQETNLYTLSKQATDRKSTRVNSSHKETPYAARFM